MELYLLSVPPEFIRGLSCSMLFGISNNDRENDIITEKKNLLMAQEEGEWLIRIDIESLASVKQSLF